MKKDKELTKAIEEIIFKIKGSNFVAEHNMVHTPTLNSLKEELLSLFKQHAKSIKKRDVNNCPFCQAEERGVSEGWGLSPEGWEQLKERHEKYHD